jgi:4-hydroxy-4-methyl-2-oxoglutarate aldolase
MDAAIRPTTPSTWFAGPAVTIDAYEDHQPNDDPYAKIFEAYENMRPGDVVVLATNGEVRSGSWGELLATASVARGVNAIVTDGLVRDVRKINEMGYGCCCRGFSPLDSAGRAVAAGVQVTVRCGGTKVRPGDLILADYEGVVVIPAQMRQQVFERAQEKLKGENLVRQELAEGNSPRKVFDKYGIL